MLLKFLTFCNYIFTRIREFKNFSPTLILFYLRVLIQNSVLRFEDGTVPFLSIAALRHGFDTFKRLSLTMELVSKHVFSLAQYVFLNISTMHHFNGEPVAILYNDTNFHNEGIQGGILNFNLLRYNGEFIGYAEVSIILF